MGLFGKRQEVSCPVCDIALGNHYNAIYRGAHLLTHLEDRPGERLGLPCGHPDAEWSIHDNFPLHATDHVWKKHR